MSTPYNLISRDAQTALTEFSLAFDTALSAAAVDQWSKGFGLSINSRAMKTIVPIPVSAAGYVKRTGDDKLRRLYERSASIVPVEYIDGVVELASVVEAPDFIGWMGEPGRIAVEGQRLMNTLVAALLEANAVLEFDGKALFADDHPVNFADAALGTFDNLHSVTAADTALIKAVKERFRKRKAANGKPLGLRCTDVLVPPALEETFRVLLESDLMYSATLAGGSNTQQTTSNIYKGSMNLVPCDELTADNVVYFVDRNGPAPWILQDGGSPEEIRYTKDDSLYKDTGKIGMKYVLLAGAVGAMPHAIEKVTITG